MVFSQVFKILRMVPSCGKIYNNQLSFEELWNYRNYSSYYILREKCPYSELFWSVFSPIPTEYEEILCISPGSVRMRENTDQNNSEYRHFSRSDSSMEELMSSIISWFFETNCCLWCVRSSCLEVFCKKGMGMQLYWKRDSDTGVFLWILRNS